MDVEHWIIIISTSAFFVSSLTPTAKPPTLLQARQPQRIHSQPVSFLLYRKEIGGKLYVWARAQAS